MSLAKIGEKKPVLIPLLPGEVELENVPLRRDALRFASEGSGGPDAYLSSVDVKCGLIGRIKLKIPVSRYHLFTSRKAGQHVLLVQGGQGLGQVTFSFLETSVHVQPL